MDVAKLVAALLSGEQALHEMYGVEKVTAARVPLVQVPTTAGTGSEVTSVAIVTTGESSKAGVVSRALFADAVLLDPGLTLGLPPQVTATTGIDAMVHAIEAYTSKRLKNPASDMLALKALSLMSSSIVTAVENGEDINARSNMLLGVVLPHVLRFNAPEAEHLYRQLMPAILPDVEINNASEQLAKYFLSLAEKFGLETHLRQLGIPQNALENLAEQSMLQERLLINNPRSISYDQALAIYQQAY